MRFIAALDTSIYGVAYLQGAPVDTAGWTRRMMLQFLDNGIIAPADISREMLSQVTLDEIGDVDATDPVDGYTLRWDTETETWVAGPASDVNTLDELEDVDLAYAVPDSGDVLTYDAAAGQWHALPGGGGGGSGVDEVWVDPDEPVVSTYKLWVDTDEEPEAPLTGGSAGRFFDYVYEPGGMAAARTMMAGEPSTEGLLHFDVEDQASATEMYVSPLTSSGVDVSARIAEIPVGAQLWVQDRDDSSMHATFTMTGPSSYDAGMGMWVAPVSYVEAGSGDPLVPGQPVLAGTLESTGGGGGTTILDGVGTPTIDTGADENYYVDSVAHLMYGPKDSAALDAPRFTNVDTDTWTSHAVGTYRLGMEYQFLVAGKITGARFWHTAASKSVPRKLFLFTSGAMVAQSLDTSEVDGVSAWVRASFATPVIINPGQKFVIAYDANNEDFPYTAPPGPTMLDTAKVAYVSARYNTSIGDSLEPTTSQPNVNRFVDLEFRPAGGSIWPLAVGGGDAAYRHYQSSAAAVWTINHALGFIPNVTVVDSLGVQVWPGRVEYPTDTQVRITFSAALGGQAYLS